MRAAGKIEYAGPGAETSCPPVETATHCHARSVAYGFTLLKPGPKFSGGDGRPSPPSTRGESLTRRDAAPVLRTGGPHSAPRSGEARVRRTGPRPANARGEGGPAQKQRRKSVQGGRPPGPPGLSTWCRWVRPRAAPAPTPSWGRGAPPRAGLSPARGRGPPDALCFPHSPQSLPDYRPGFTGAPGRRCSAAPSGGWPAPRRRRRRP